MWCEGQLSNAHSRESHKHSLFPHTPATSRWCCKQTDSIFNISGTRAKGRRTEQKRNLITNDDEKVFFFHLPDICRCIFDDVPTESERRQAGETFCGTQAGFGREDVKDNACHTRAAAILEGVHQGDTPHVPGGAGQRQEPTVGRSHRRLQCSQRRECSCYPPTHTGCDFHGNSLAFYRLM